MCPFQYYCSKVIKRDVEEISGHGLLGIAGHTVLTEFLNEGWYGRSASDIRKKLKKEYENEIFKARTRHNNFDLPIQERGLKFDTYVSKMNYFLKWDGAQMGRGTVL
jgi:hypothetical protein